MCLCVCVCVYVRVRYIKGVWSSYDPLEAAGTLIFSYFFCRTWEIYNSNRTRKKKKYPKITNKQKNAAVPDE